MSKKDKIELRNYSNNSTKADNKLLSSSEGIDILLSRTEKPSTKSLLRCFSSKSNILNLKLDVMNNKSKCKKEQSMSISPQPKFTFRTTAKGINPKFINKSKPQTTKGYISKISQITAQKIEREIDYMKAFLENTVNMPKSLYKNKYENYIKETIRKNLIHLPIISDLVESQKEILEKKMIKNNPEYTRYLMNLSNPSIGLEGLRKRFPGCFKSGFKKYHNCFRSNYKSKILESTMVSFRIKNESNEQNKYDSKVKKKLTSAIKQKLKWKTIQWFKDTQKAIINKLLMPYFTEQFLNLLIKKRKEGNEGITFDEFSKVLRTNGITKNQEIMRKLYWIFDEDGDNSLTYNEILSGIEIFRESTPEEKVKVFFELCDTDGSNTVSKDEFLALLKKTIVNSNNMHSLKRVVDKIFKSVDSNDTGELTL